MPKLAVVALTAIAVLAAHSSSQSVAQNQHVRACVMIACETFVTWEANRRHLCGQQMVRPGLLSAGSQCSCVIQKFERPGQRPLYRKAYGKVIVFNRCR